MKAAWAWGVSLLRGSRFIQHVAWLAGGTALGQALVMLTSPFITRLYSPAEFGAFSIYTAILAIATGLVSLRYELAIPLPPSEGEAANLAALSLLSTGAMSGLGLLAVWGLHDKAAAWAETPALDHLLWLLPLSLLLIGAGQVVSYWATRRSAFPRVAKGKIVESVAQVVTQTGFGLLRTGGAGLAAGRALAAASGAAVVAVGVWRQDRHTFAGVSPAGIWQVARRYHRFPTLACGATLLNSLGLQLAPLLLGLLYGAETVGWFGLSQRMVGVPVTVIGEAVAQVYTGELARLSREEPGAMWDLFRRTAGRLLAVGTVPILALGLGGPWLFGHLFGYAWRESGHFTRLVTGMVLLQFVAVPLSYTLDALERQDLQLLWDGSRLGLVTGALWLSARFGLSSDGAVLLYGSAMMLGYIALLWLSAMAVRRASRRSDSGMEVRTGS